MMQMEVSAKVLSVNREAETRAMVELCLFMASQASNNKAFLYHLNQMLSGYIQFLEKGATPHQAYDSMRNISVMTNWKFNQLFKQSMAQVYPKKGLQNLDSLLGSFSVDELVSINQTMQTLGIYRFQNKVSTDLCQRIVEMSLRTPSWLNYKKDQPGLYDPNHPKAAIYYYPEQCLINNDAICSIAFDPVVLAIAEEYLQCQPILNLINMWWSTTYNDGDEVKSKAAQLFHFDASNVNFLKFFVYLTDVNLETGPHVFISQSQGAKPQHLLRDGRFTDQEIHQAYPENQRVVMTGSQGTIFVADTGGFHKGLQPISGHRLFLSFYYSNSRFGDALPDTDMDLRNKYLSDDIKKNSRLLSGRSFTN